MLKNEQELKKYDNSYLYCINTNTKIFELNGILYTDWDEVYDETLIKYNNLNIKQNGFNSSSKVKMNNGIEKNISDISIGDILFNGNIVYGIVNLIDLEKKNKLFNLLISGEYFIVNNFPTYDYNYIVSTISNF